MKGLSTILLWSGIVISTLAVVLFILIFYPVFLAELSYLYSNKGKNVSVISQNEKTKNKNVIVPRDENFGIVIPKINANAKVIKDVNPLNSSQYQWALTKGVAHAKGSAYPGQFGNVFLFSHSSVDFYEAARYNSIFYLLTKLEKGDDVYIFYNKAKIKYTVTGKKIVGANAVSYLKNSQGKHQLTLMTCWPPGTTLNRLLVTAEISK